MTGAHGRHRRGSRRPPRRPRPTSRDFCQRHAKLEALATCAPGTESGSTTITADLTDPARPARVAGGIRPCKPNDIPINNAGANVASGFADAANAELEVLNRLNMAASTLSA